VESSQQLFSGIRSLLRSSSDRRAKAEQIAGIIRNAGRYRWVGIYEVEGEDIAVVAWSGPGAPTHARFPANQGLCGAAFHSGSAVAAGDVSSDPRYLTTLGSTRSEIVVPILLPGTGAVLGMIDVESDQPNAFTDDDRVLLEGCAAVLAGLWDRLQ
jgi:GAF domain-containing protein